MNRAPTLYYYRKINTNMFVKDINHETHERHEK